MARADFTPNPGPVKIAAGGCMARRLPGGLFLLAIAASTLRAQENPPVDITAPAPPSAPAPAAPPAPPPPAATHWYDEIELHGFISFSITANFNDPKAVGDTVGHNQYRAFDLYANSYSLDEALLQLSRPVNKPGDVGGLIVV